MNCRRCGKKLTVWRLFWGWFWWLPRKVDSVDPIWEECCSYKCYRKVMKGGQHASVSGDSQGKYYKGGSENEKKNT